MFGPKKDVYMRYQKAVETWLWIDSISLEG